MHQNPITVLGIPLPSDSPGFLVLIAVHVMAGLGCVVTGMIAILSPKMPGRHPRFGTLYYGCLAVVFVSMAILSTLRWTEDYHLFVLGALSFGASFVARSAVRKRGRGWVRVHVSGMGLSYILLLTAFYVDNGRNLPLWRDLPTLTYWLLPAAVGIPLIVRTLRRHPLALAERQRIAEDPTGRAPVLTVAEARAFYNRFGKMQDSQGFYEDTAVDELIAHANFQQARKVFEFGCGTGKLAARLLSNYLPSSASYLGYDVSPVMAGLAKKRLDAYAGRATVALSDGAMSFPLPDGSADRVVSTYVLDLLSEKDIRQFFDEAFRVLAPGGKLCLASVTEGVNVPSRVVASLSKTVFRLHASLIGGCRPIRLESYCDHERWQLAHRKVVTPFGVPSEVLVLNSRRA